MKKKILINLAIICIIFGGAFNAYAQVSLFSCGRIQFPVYAADDTPIWEPVNQNDLVEAFRYYCKSRNVFIEGSVADALTTFTTRTFNSLCNTLGIDITQLQAELKKTYDNNLGQRFLFTHSGISLYNRIFAEFLQNNDLEEGDVVDNEVIYSNLYFTDSEGYSCYIYETDHTGNSYVDVSTVNYKLGTPYKYTASDIQSGVLASDNGRFITNYSLLGTSSQITFYKIEHNTYYLIREYVSDWTIYDSRDTSIYGNPCILHVTTNDRYYFGAFGFNDTNNTIYFRAITRLDNSNVEDNSQNANIYINSNNNTINNNTYNNNYTIIYNDGDYYEDDGEDEPSPSTPPSGGGGGGGDDPNPDEPPVIDPTPTPDPHIPDWDIELPDMPSGSEWLLYGMEKKFPWDIPYNLMFMLSLFAAEPETPHFEGTIDLKICEWNYDIDLAPFDNIARYVRDFEFIGFLIGLMLITRKLIWG